MWYNFIRYLAACIITSWPMTHPLNIAWMSENTGSVGKRTVASGAVIGAANIFARGCLVVCRQRRFDKWYLIYKYGQARYTKRKTLQVLPFLITATLDQYCNLLVIPQILKSEMSSTSLFLEPRLFCGLSRRHTTNTVIERMRRFAKGWAMRNLRRKKRIWKSGETLAHYLSLRHKVQFERVDSAPCKWNYVMP